MKNLIHKTSSHSLVSIKNKGFIIFKDEPKRFGNGIYFMTNDDFGEFGDGSKIICDVDDKYICHMTHDEIREIYPYLEYQEGGEPELENYILEKGFKGVSISYIDDTTEVVVYDTNIIKIKDFIMDGNNS